MSSSNSTCYLLLDLDRVLYNTDVLSKLYLDTIHSISPDSAQKIARKEADERGGGFDIASYSRTVLSPEQFQRALSICCVQARRRPSKHYMPGARDALAYLRSCNHQYGIFTYGNLEWQRLKLSIIDCGDIPHYITSNPDKPAQIKRWYNEEMDAFILPTTLKAHQPIHTLVMVDDKISNVTGLPARASGAHITAGATTPTAHDVNYSSEHISIRLIKTIFEER